MYGLMGNKIEAQMDNRYRLTLPEEIREHLKIKEGDDLWFEQVNDGKIVIGRVEVSKKIIE